MALQDLDNIDLFCGAGAVHRAFGEALKTWSSTVGGCMIP